MKVINMKLNKRGWGLKEMLIMSAILFALLLIVTYYIISLYHDLAINDRKYYTDLEVKIQTAAVKYTTLYGEKEYISLDDLKNVNLIDALNDENGNRCNGYVKVKGYNYYSYVSCDDYTTSGYNKKFE